MGAIFTILTIRGALLAMAIVSTSVIALVTIPNNQPVLNPFTPYANILPGQSSAAVSQRGFGCQFNLTPNTAC